MKHSSLSVKFKVDHTSEVGGILVLPETTEFIFLFAHGAGAGMNHPFMENMARYLADEYIGTFRFNFPYMEKKSKRPDPPMVLMKTIQSAFIKAREYAEDIPVLAGGKSMGGRMTSLAASKELLKGITGIVFLGFPLHAPAKPSYERAEHLNAVKTPMLFLQGTNDQLADLSLLKPVIDQLGEIAALHIVESADHSFKLPKKAGRNEVEVFQELSEEIRNWARTKVKAS